MPCDNNTKTSSEIEHVDWSTGTGSGHHYANVRFGSGSSQASQSSGDICRICHCESDPQNPLLTPCYCAGSLKYVHQSCLQQWLTASETNSCELCKFPFIMHTKIKPFNEWRSLDISGIERRRLCCSVLFHCAAALCVIWSLCVLIERAADDVQRGLIDWPFWTKLAVVTVGLTGGVVFMYIQCKAYLHLCHRWKARNRILLIQNAPEKMHPVSPPSPAAHHRNRNPGSLETRNSAVNGCGGGAMDISSNVASAANTYNYSNIGGNGNGGTGMEPNNTNPMHHHLPSSPHHMLQQVDLDIDPLAPRSSSIMHQQQHYFVPQHQLGQVAVSANIECSQSQHNYERDWALDDVVSQISSFRPCPQGSGSLTPFHDSIHNVLEHSESSSRGSVNDVCGGSRQDLSTGAASNDTGREHAFQLSSFSGSEHKAPSISSGASNAVANGLGGFVYKPHTNKRYSNSSIFLENRDILNDSVMSGLDPANDYPKIKYRHSSILTPTDSAGDNMEKYLGKDLRRYSDTKLLASAGDAHDYHHPHQHPHQHPHHHHHHDHHHDHDHVHDPMLFNANMDPVESIHANSSRVRQLFKQHSATAPDTVLDMELPTSPLSPPPAYAGQQRQTSHALCGSLHTVDVETVLPSSNVRFNSNPTAQQIDKARLFFKSLPNLNSSCESLIQK